MGLARRPANTRAAESADLREGPPTATELAFITSAPDGGLTPPTVIPGPPTPAAPPPAVAPAATVQPAVAVPSAPDPAPKAPRPPRPTGERGPGRPPIPSSEPLQTLTTKLPVSVMSRVRVLAAQRGETIAAVLADLLTRSLDDPTRSDRP